MKCFFLKIVLLLWSSNAFSQYHQSLKKSIDKVIRYDTDFSFEKTPGFLIGIKIDRSIHTFNYGHFLSQDSTLSVDSLYFHLGGLSKTITANLIHLLIEHDVLSLEDTLADFFPHGRFNSPIESLTIESLLTHQSGLPKQPTNLFKCQKSESDRYAHYNRECLIDFLNSVRKLHRNFIYSDVNYAILYEILIHLMQEDTIAQLLTERWKALGFSGRPLHPEVLTTKNPGIDKYGQIVPPQNSQSFEGSLGYVASLRELLNYMENLFSDPISIKTYEPKVLTPYTPEVWMAHAWHIFPNPKTMVVHSGRNGGHYAFIGFTPESQRGVIILANGESGTQDLGFLLLRLINHNWK